jgi:antitoxin YefM
MAITASEARKNLFPLIEQVNENREPIEITSKRGDAVLMSRADYDALNETALVDSLRAWPRHTLGNAQRTRFLNAFGFHSSGLGGLLPLASQR